MASSFESILFESVTTGGVVLEKDEPAFFADVNLDQVVESITDGRDEYDLRPFFYTRLTTADAVAYRHEIFRDLENEAVFSHIATFADGLCEMRKHLAHMGRLHYRYAQEAWLLDAAEMYCEAVGRLARHLALEDLRSRGLRAFREYVTDYVESERFKALLGETKQVKDGLVRVRYCINVRGNRVKVSRYESESDYSAEIERTFAKFKRAAAKHYRAQFSVSLDMNHVEAHVLGLVARLHPEVFAALDAYCERHRSYLDDVLASFDREVQFYLAYLEYVARLAPAGLQLCYPVVSDQSKAIVARDTFDIALANKLVRDRSSVVCNDFYLAGDERIIVVSGPNQGGKTTFARTFGQLHHLSSIGCTVPGTEAQLYLFDELFTHFEREEQITSLSGKLEDDLVRIHEILERATSDSIVIMNESFTSTTLRDALVLGTSVMEQILELDLLCLYVTFIDEFASMGESTVSMVSTVLPGDPASRTYKLVRSPADGLAYAAAIAEKYGLTYERVKERISS